MEYVIFDGIKRLDRVDGRIGKKIKMGGKSRFFFLGIVTFQKIIIVKNSPNGSIGRY